MAGAGGVTANAGVAQSEEQLPCTQRVAGSSPAVGSIMTGGK